MFTTIWSNIGKLWCIIHHKSLMWPIHGAYECRTCGHRYPAFAEVPVRNWTGRATLKPAVSLMLALALAALASPAFAISRDNGKTTAAAEAALERYTASGGSVPWAVESVEIHAALPKAEKIGNVRVVRDLTEASQGQYELLQLAGDRTVHANVIARYLAADERLSAMPAESVAITPANYKFAYKGVVDDGEYLAYVFQISPRRKRQGLIKGELWLDQRSGALVRQSGRLVKSPLASVRRVSVTREDAVRAGRVESRLTHITCKTRRAGSTVLVVEERPLRSADAVRSARQDREGF